MSVLKFGTNFIVLNDVCQALPTHHRTKTGKQYIHLATVAAGLSQFVAYADPDTNYVYIEEIDTTLGMLVRIENDQLWQDLRDFLWAAKLLEVGKRKEIPVSKEMADTLGLLFKARPREI